MSNDSLRRALAEYGAVLTVQEIATALQFREDTITNWLSAGTLRGFRIGRSWRVVKDELIDDLSARYNTPAPLDSAPAELNAET